MGKMSSHFIGIRQGKIELTFKGEDSTNHHQFADEDKAVEALATKMIESNHYRMLNSSSCDFPADDGRPDFNHERFEQKLVDKLVELGATA